MSENHPGGFAQHPRQPIGYRPVRLRVRDSAEIYAPQWQETTLRAQGTRCMDCGVATCSAGCPIGNRIPEWNDLVSRGHWREALVRLHATNNFPEFTGYTCPAPCEATCVLAINDAPVSIKSIERAIVDVGWAERWIVPEPPLRRSGYRVAIVGSGPAGLACAQQLCRAGHAVTVFERDDVPGGLMTYGIPDFKFAKFRVARRIMQLEAEGVAFRCNVNVGSDISLTQLRSEHDAVCLAIGALAPREVDVPGRELDGVELAMPYLIAENRRVAGRPRRGPSRRSLSAAGRHVVVLGGGDTGADCVATALRQGARNVVQVDINDPRPSVRSVDNPWPEAPLTAHRSYAQEEGCDEEYGFEVSALVGTHGHISAVVGDRVTWRYAARRRRIDARVVEAGVRLQSDMVLVAIGFAGAEVAALNEPRLAAGGGTIAVDPDMMTPLDGVFAAGDARMGQSIVVWAIGEGRDAACSIDRYLTGTTRLPASLRTRNPPLDVERLGTPARGTELSR